MHPLDHFHNCPHCGSPQFTQINVKAKRCAACHFTYYANACAATACFIRNAAGELLVARRAKEPACGTLDLPGGFVDMDETAEEALRRELQEETGLTGDYALRYLFSLPNRYEYSGMTIHTLDLFYEAHAPDGWTPCPADDVSELLFLPLAQLDPAAFGLCSIRTAVRRLVCDQLG